MSDDDPLMNCLLEVCCAPAAAVEALATWMEDELGSPRDECLKYAHKIHSKFDLAPKGTLGAFKAEIARLARG